MCGEHTSHGVLNGYTGGSSPHVRGALTQLLSNTLWTGIIPACAGSTRLTCKALWTPRDHPRMCGEHDRGLQSRWRCMGSSPHVRGALGNQPPRGSRVGIIPACAGSTWLLPFALLESWDHPRMCGEHQTVQRMNSFGPGSSPHVRGALITADPRTKLTGIIPACAGSTRGTWATTCRARDHPRMCGEHFFRDDELLLAEGSSPHVRGARSA